MCSILLLSIIYGSFIYIFIFYLMGLIHELGHYFFAKMFSVKVNAINFHPLGFSLDLDNCSYLPFFKQLLIYLGGPLTFFINQLVLFIFKEANLISVFVYNLSVENNLSLLLFNLIPFYPLDGGKILELILFKFISAFKTKIVILITSSIVSIYLIYLCINQNQFLLFFFIITNLISSIVFFKKNYLEYLYSRIGNVSKFKKCFSNYPNIKHFSYNYILLKDNFIDEENYILSKKIKNLL